MKKNLVLLICVLLLSASCNLFSTPVTAGMVKTLNGGADWKATNKMKDVNTGSIGTSNISKIVLDPQNHEIVFAGAFSGGLFKSEDSGQTWSRILSKIAVYDFAVNPFDPKTIYASGSFGATGKVLKTTDGGASWQEVYNEASNENPVRAIAINPVLPNQIVLGTYSGTVVRSFDGGLSWKLSKDLKAQINSIVWQNGQVFVLTKTKGLFASENTSDDFKEITTSITNPLNIGSFSYSLGKIESFFQMYPDPLSPSLIYLTTNLGLYKTTDGGKNWQNISLPVKNVENNRAITLAKNSSNVVYTSVGSTIYKSVDGGNAWQTQSIASSGYVQYILVDPQLPQVVYAGMYVRQQ